MIYPRLREFIELFWNEFSSLNNREQIADILYTKEKEEKAIQSMMNWIMRRYKLYKNWNYYYDNEVYNNEIWRKCDFVVDDFFNKVIQMQDFIEVKYVNW
jgi:hypothetical protein